MGQAIVLDNILHKDLRVLTTPAARFGDNISLIAVVPAEFQRLIAHYPILLRKDAQTGQFAPVALTGFATGENLFLDNSGWLVDYVPLHVRRQPFQISLRSGPDGPEPLLAIDLDSPRISQVEGERLFRDHGGTTDYLQAISGILSELMDGVDATRVYVDALTTHDLIEPVALQVSFADGQSTTVQGLYTLHSERLRNLPAAIAGALHAAGVLELAHVQIASLAHIPALIERRNQRLLTTQAA